MKQVKLLSVLIVLLIGLTALVYFDEWKTEKEESLKEQENRLTVFTPDVVDEIDYYSHLKDDTNQAASEKPLHVKLKKNADGNWNIIEPVQARASLTIADDLFTILLNYKYEKKVGNGNFSEFGLVEPSRKITLTFSPESKLEPLSIMVGAKAPVGYSVYSATSKSDEVYVGGQYLLVSLGKTINEFRDKAVATLNIDDITQLSYSRAGATQIDFAKKDDVFQIVAPMAVEETDQAVVTKLLSDLGDAKAEDFIDDPTPEFANIFSGGQPNLVTISWTDSTGANSYITFTENNDHFYASSNPQKLIFKIAKAEKDKFLKTLLDFRDKRIFKFSAASLSKAEVDGKIFVQVGQNWYAEENTERTKENTLIAKKDAKELAYIKSFLQDLSVANTLEFFDLNGEIVADINRKVPLHKVILYPENTQQKAVTVEFFASLQGHINIRRSEGKYLYLVKSTLIDPLEKKEDYVPPPPASEPQSEYMEPGSHADHIHSDHEG